MAKITEFLKFIGVTYEEGVDMPVFEDNYIKFMSNGGGLDSKQCDQFEIWLKSQGASYERHRDRAIRNLDDFIVEKMNAKLDELWPD